MMASLPLSPLFSRRWRSSWAAILVVAVALLGHALAVAAEAQELPETLILDPRTPTLEDGTWLMLSHDDIERREMRKRVPQEKENKPTTTLQIAVSTAKTTTKTTSTSTSTSSASPLPSPLDGGLSANFTQDAQGNTPCPTFINSFLTNETFKRCYPLSMLMKVGHLSLLFLGCSVDLHTCTAGIAVLLPGRAATR